MEERITPWQHRDCRRPSYDGPVPLFVFISHSSKDKERFVNDFARRLQQAGVETWLDDDRLRPGDSLTEQIFTQGLGAADVVIAVLSANSINSSWVREELRNAANLKIEGRCKIVPAVLDNAELPDFLKDTVHVKIADCSSYDREFRRILDAIRDSDRRQPAPGTAADSGIALEAIDEAASPAATETAVAADEVTVRLRESMEELDDLVRNIPTPADQPGNHEANEAVRQWRHKALVAIPFVETAVPNYPSQPISDPALVALVDDMEATAEQAISELSEHTEVHGRLGHVTVTIGTKCLLEVRSKLGTVAKCYEEHLWDRFSKRGIPPSG